MSDFQPGQAVTIVSLGRNRTIMAVSGEHALCKSFTSGEEDWFPFSDLRPDRPAPMRPFFT